MEYSPPPFFRRGPGLITRLGFFALLSLILLYVDSRFHHLEMARKAIGVLLHPLQQVSDLPGEVADRIGDFFVTQSSLKRDNERLSRENFLNAGLLQTQQALLAENRTLRQLLEFKEQYQHGSVAAEVLYFGRDPFSRRIVVDKGASQSVEEGAAVVNATGLIGQVNRAFPWTAEVTLITDREQVVPVQVVRNGLRAALFGIGYDGALDLRFMPLNADIENGDLLVTSGIDGVYPSGLPVAVVSNIERNAAYPFARIICTPASGPDRHRQVLILSRLAPLPAYPAADQEEPVKRRKSRKGG